MRISIGPQIMRFKKIHIQLSHSEVSGGPAPPLTSVRYDTVLFPLNAKANVTTILTRHRNQRGKRGKEVLLCSAFRILRTLTAI